MGQKPMPVFIPTAGRAAPVGDGFPVPFAMHPRPPAGAKKAGGETPPLRCAPQSPSLLPVFGKP